jgi:hypothetical protein
MMGKNSTAVIHRMPPVADGPWMLQPRNVEVLLAFNSCSCRFHVSPIRLPFCE